MRPAPLAMVFVLCAACVLDSAPGDDPGTDDGKADGAGGEGACRSPMFGHVYDAIRAAAPADTPGELVATTYNRLDPQPRLRGPAIFARMADLIAAAEHEVTFETWKWDTDSEPTRTLVAGLVRLGQRRAAAGVTSPPVVVNLLLNDSPNYASDYIASAYVQIAAAKLDPNHIKVVLASYEHLLLGANHSKTVTVDGRIAIVAGTNASADNGGSDPYYDAGFVVEGDAALAIRQSFASAWLDPLTERWKCEERWQDAYDPDLAHSYCEEPNAPLPPLTRPVLVGLSRDDVCSPVLVTTREASGVPLPSHGSHDDALAQAFLTAVALATTRVQIQTPNLNEPVIVAALLATARSGIRVEVVLSEHYEDLTESFPGRGGTNAETVDYIYDQLASFPDACERFAVRWYSQDGITSVTEDGPPASHVKLMIVDDELVFVGSSNQDVQSWHNSREIAVIADDPATVAAWRSVFTFDRAVATDRCGR